MKTIGVLKLRRSNDETGTLTEARNGCENNGRDKIRYY